MPRPKNPPPARGEKARIRREREATRRAIEINARRLDAAHTAVRLARFGGEGPANIRAQWWALIADPGLTSAERVARFREISLKNARVLAPSEAREEYGEAWDALYSPEFLAEVEKLKQGDASALETAIAYLEADPWHFRSGYLKEKLARYLRKVPLSESDAERLRVAILAAITKGKREDLMEYIRLARVIKTPAFRTSLASLAESADEDTRWRAVRMLGGLDATRK